MRRVVAAAIGLIAALFAGGCQTTALVESKEPFRITRVEVSKAKADLGTVNLPEDVRVKTLRTAYRFSETGREKFLKVELQNIHFKNPVAALLVADNNRLSAKISVVDKASGKSEATFNSVVSNKGALNGISGAVIAAAQSQIEVEQQLAAHLAEDIMKKVYGNAFAKSVRDRVALGRVTPNYPRSYADLKHEFYCKQKREGTEIETGNPGGDVFTEKFKIPEECKKVAFTSGR